MYVKEKGVVPINVETIKNKIIPFITITNYI